MKRKNNLSTFTGRKQRIHELAEAAKQIVREERELQENDKDIEFNFGANVKQEGPKRVQ